MHLQFKLVLKIKKHEIGVKEKTLQTSD